MEKTSFFDWLKKVPELSDKQREEAIAELRGKECDPDIPLAIREAVAECCPHCASNRLAKNGQASGLQRWKCQGCGKSFNILTKTPFARLRKKEKWVIFALAMIDGLSVRRSAELCDVHYNTTFLWRHRFAENLKRAQCTELSGIAECDVTLFYRSEKGRKVRERKARKRGGDGIPKGFGHHLVSVLTLRDRNGNGAERIASTLVSTHAIDLYNKHLKSDTLLLTDGDLELRAAVKSINKAAETLNPLAHKALIGTAKSRGKKGNPFHIQTVNGFHSHLRRWMERFHGVSTRYLGNYIGWHRHLMEKHHKNDPDLFIRLIFNPSEMHPQLTMI